MPSLGQPRDFAPIEVRPCRAGTGAVFAWGDWSGHAKVAGSTGLSLHDLRFRCCLLVINWTNVMTFVIIGLLVMNTDSTTASHCSTACVQGYVSGIGGAGGYWG